MTPRPATGAAGGRRRGAVPRSATVRAVRAVWAADRRGFLVAAAMQLVGALAALGLVLASKLALQAVLVPEVVLGPLVLALALLALATAVSGSIGALQAQQQRLLGEKVSQSVWRRLLTACACVDLLTYESNEFVQRLERVRGNAVSRPASVVGSLLGAAGSLLGVVALAGALISIQPLLVPILLVAGVPAVLISRRASRAEFAFATDVTDVSRRRGYLKLLLSHRIFAAETRAFDSSPELLRRHGEDDDRYLARLTTHVRLRQRYSLLTTGAAGLTLAAALLAIVALVESGRISLADAGAAAIAARLLGGQLGTVFSSIGSLIESGPFLADLDTFVDAVPAGPGPGRAQPLHHGLRVEDVHFRYQPDQDDALRGVSIQVPAGAVVALVGENGSGKTTLAKVVAGLYEARRGELTWDDATISQQDLRASVSVIFQDFVRYQMSPLDNIAISDTQRPLDRARAEHAADEVGLSAKIGGMRDGFDTVLGMEISAGTDLSGGQWQRLALARSLYRDAGLVVLDEPTAALDPRAEHDLFADVRRVLDGRAALLISHRYSSVRLADHIYVLADGQVSEHGTHEELVAAGGQYAELYALQAAAYLQ